MTELRKYIDMENAGIVTWLSTYTVKETIDRLKQFIEKNGGTIYARIDQQAELRKAGIDIHPLEFLLFGDPHAGGKLIQENTLVALDLPLKIIAWEDEQKKVWLAYNQASYLEARHALKPDSTSPLNLDKLISKALNNDTLS